MKYLFSFLIILSAFGLRAQHQAHHVNDMIQQQEWYDAHPELKDDVEKLQKQLKDELQFYNTHSSAKRGENYLIPVVFHVLHEGGAENISDEQVEDAMNILTRDFNFQNPDTADILPIFQSVAGNSEISFRLAKIDPFGNPTNGITRTFTNLTNDAGEGSKIVSWPRDKYLNIWVVNSIASGAAGYTFYPSSAQFFPSRDGIIILHNYVGSIGTGSARRSRALTHEIGHWIDLPHTWGSTNEPGLASNCSTDDGVMDTPNTQGWRSCNLNGANCNSSIIENVQNYMDYSYCYTMFTKGQVARMRTALTSTVAERSSLITTSNHKATGVKDNVQANWTSDKDVICEGETVRFIDKSNYDQNTWSWSFEDGLPASSNDTNPSVMFSAPGQYNVSLEVSDGVNTNSKTVSADISVVPSEGIFTPYVEGFENPAYSELLWLTRNEKVDGSNGWGFASETAYDGNYCLVNRNYGSEPGRTDEFVSTTLDWSSFESAFIDFKLAFRQRTQDDNDRLRLYISNDCGATWKLRWVKTGVDLATGQPTNAFFIPNRSEWVNYEVDNFQESDLVDNVILKFVFESDGGNQLYIDNILVAGLYDDVPVLNFPENGQDELAKDIIIDWKPILGVSGYEYEIDTDTSFSSPNLMTDYLDYISVEPHGEDTEQNLELDPGQTYFWRVRSYFNSEISDWSSVWSFQVSSNGEGDTLSHRQLPDATVGLVEQQTKTDLKLYPNPLANEASLFIEFSRAISGELQFYNPMGQLVYSKEIKDQSRTEIDGSELPKGLIWLNFNSKSETINRSIFVK